MRREAWTQDWLVFTGVHYIEVGWLVDAGAATGVAREVCCGVARGRSREACGDRHRDVG